jgi:hypothetical protein
MLIRHKNYITKFVHDLKYEDYQDNNLDINNFYDSDGYHGNIPIKPDALEKFIESYQRRILRLKNLINDKSNVLIFVRYQNISNDNISPEVPIDTLENIITLYKSLKQFCNGSKFILICVSNSLTPWPSPNLDINICQFDPNILFNDEQSVCLIGRYNNIYFLNMVLKNIFNKILTNQLPINIKF